MISKTFLFVLLGCFAVALSKSDYYIPAPEPEPTTTEAPVTDAPPSYPSYKTGKDITDSPTTTEAVTDSPTTTAAPKTDAPPSYPSYKIHKEVTDSPTTTEAVTDAPTTTEAPVTDAPPSYPSYKNPKKVTDSPTTTEAATDAPTTAAPKTDSPPSYPIWGKSPLKIAVKWVSKWESITEKVQKHWFKLQYKAGETMKKIHLAIIKDTCLKFFADIKEKIESMKQQGDPKSKAQWQKVSNTVEECWGQVKNIGQESVENAKKIFDDIKTKLQAQFDELKEKLAKKKEVKQGFDWKAKFYQYKQW